MRILVIVTSLAVCGMLAAPSLAWAGDAEVEHEFVGVDGCRICHKSEKKGNQHGQWLNSRHAKAYETLGTEKAKELAVAAGLTGNPQELDECLSCHVTAHGVKAELLGKKYSIADGVGCESCHGPGGDYKGKKVMESREASIAAGLIIPTEETCVQCHNERSPTFTGFEYAEMWAKIAHPNPLNVEGAAEAGSE